MIDRLQNPARTWMFVVLAAIALASFAHAQEPNRVRERYTKYEYMVPMRDGVHLFTSIYVPKDKTKSYPFLLTRTPYSVGPYGVDQYRTRLGPSQEFEDEGFIFVYQDARGRYMSEGEFQQVRPAQPNKKTNQDIDESSDTYDTIEWLLANVQGHNGRVGMVGVSQPGFHVAASMIDSHPALKCASPQAPTADYYMGDDVYHNGAFMLAANFWFYSFFQPRVGGPALPVREEGFFTESKDGYQLFLSLPPLADVNQELFGGTARYWQEIVDHPTYDAFWQKRSLWQHMENVRCAVLNVGGWYDAEDPMGPFHVYRAVEKKNAKTPNTLVMGPWAHGGWSHGSGDRLGNLQFAFATAEVFRKEIEFPFFMHYLKDKPMEFSEAVMFLTGIDEYRRLDAWPPATVRPMTLFLADSGRLATTAPNQQASEKDEYVSDPNRPVPYVNAVVRGMTHDYMTEDQRFAAQRPDVLVYRTEPLDEDLVVAGPIAVKLFVSTSGTDADFVVKLIDVYPDDYPELERGEGISVRRVPLGGYQRLVRGEPFRGKYRHSFEKPDPFTPGVPDTISFAMPDVYHAFRKGHSVMVQIQSSWFPLVDRNPQKFMEIPKAAPADFQSAVQRVYHSPLMPSGVTVMVEPQKTPRKP